MMGLATGSRAAVPFGVAGGIRRASAAFAALALVFATCTADTATLSAPDGADWPKYGGNYDETHYSPLDQINEGNVGRLKLAWHVDLPMMMSSTGEPLAVDGTVYFAVGYSIVHAVDAITGKLLWRYDPKVTEATNEKLKIGWGIKGLAFGDGSIFVGTQDGRLLALSATTGKLLWSVQTSEGEYDGRYITGAPRVFNGKVIIGHGGGDFLPVRAYVTAYDMKTGKQAWRTFIVPGDPAKGFESKAMEMAAKTWKGEWWKHGGGGTVWHAIAYDPKYNRIYLGTGNGSPWNQEVRSPGGGDNLFLCSVLALDADTGEYVWHYQTTPGETWDYNSAMDIELATVAIDGKPRDILMHAPKNGFFYVIDRATGKLISAEPYARVTWAKYVDPATGRPVENPDARYPKGETTIWPGSQGGHNWQAMSYSPKTGLAYIPVILTPGYYNASGIDPKSWRFSSRPSLTGAFKSFLPDDLETKMADPGGAILGQLQARDPVTQQVRWSIPTRELNHGGLLSTGGNLLFQGTPWGKFEVRAADSGKLLWSFDMQNGTTGSPISYMAGGKQYVSILTGFAGGVAGTAQEAARYGWSYHSQQRRLLTFVLDGGAKLPPPPRLEPEPIVADGARADPAKASAGRPLYVAHCTLCHGPGAIAGGSAPDLRKSMAATSPETFDAVVRGGALKVVGMARFDELSPAEAEAIRHYIRGEAERALGPGGVKAGAR